jgi:hypothetical protein
MWRRIGLGPFRARGMSLRLQYPRGQMADKPACLLDAMALAILGL